MLVSQLVEFGPYPAVKKFVANHLDMQFADVRDMMKLPLPNANIHAGCNFAAAAILCNLISGISVVLYNPMSSNYSSGSKFKKLLVEFYPWELGETDKAQKSKIIYDLVRNPLAHSLGVLKRGSLPIKIVKSPLTEAQLEKIEKSEMRPEWVPLTVTNNSTEYVLSVVGLYCGTFNLLRNLARNAKQMQQAEIRITSGEL